VSVIVDFPVNKMLYKDASDVALYTTKV
jgi:hypothetical protein